MDKNNRTNKDPVIKLIAEMEYNYYLQELEWKPSTVTWLPRGAVQSVLFRVARKAYYAGKKEK